MARESNGNARFELDLEKWGGLDRRILSFELNRRRFLSLIIFTDINVLLTL
jgi:hypothetical protein